MKHHYPDNEGSFIAACLSMVRIEPSAMNDNLRIICKASFDDLIINFRNGTSFYRLIT